MIKNRLFTKTNIIIPYIKSIANNAANDFFCKWNFLTIKFASITSGTLLASALFDMIALANAIFKSFHIFFILLIFKKYAAPASARTALKFLLLYKTEKSNRHGKHYFVSAIKIIVSIAKIARKIANGKSKVFCHVHSHFFHRLRFLS